MKNLRGKICIAMVCLMVIAVINNPIISAATIKTKATVDTQKELNAALNNKNITSIVIKTNKKVKLNIPKEDYKTKRVYVKAPNATINNKGSFKSVNMYVTTQAQLDKALKNTSVQYNYLSINTTAKREFIIKGKYPKVGLIVKAPNATIKNKGKFKTVNAFVTTQEQLEKVLKDDKVTIVTINTLEDTEFIIPEGNYSGKKLVVDSLNAIITNNGHFKSTVINNGEVIVPKEEETQIPEEEVTQTPEEEVTQIPEEEVTQTPEEEVTQTPEEEVVTPQPSFPVYPSTPEPTPTPSQPEVKPEPTPTPSQPEVTPTPEVKPEPTPTPSQPEVKPNQNKVIHKVGDAYYDYTNTISEVERLKEAGELEYYSENELNYTFFYDGRDYNIRKDGSNINTVSLYDSQVDVVTGSAVSVFISGWNNVDVKTGIVDIMILTTDVLAITEVNTETGEEERVNYGYKYDDLKAIDDKELLDKLISNIVIDRESFTFNEEFTSNVKDNTIYVIRFLTNVPEIMGEYETTGTGVSMLGNVNIDTMKTISYEEFYN